MAESHLNRREHILAEAAQLFVSHGIAEVTTRRIAQAVGISQPSLYAHFASRDAIMVELCRRAFATLASRLAAADSLGGTPAERLERLSREYVDFGLSEAAAYRVAFMLEKPNEDEADKAVVLEAGGAAFATLVALFTQTHGAAGVMAAQSTWASLHGLVSLLLARQEFPWVDRDALIEHHIASVCRGALP